MNSKAKKISKLMLQQTMTSATQQKAGTDMKY